MAKTLGDVIRRRRLELGLTQDQLADRIGGVKQAEISRLEKGRITLPRRERLERIASALDLRLGDLLAASGWDGADRAFHPDGDGATGSGNGAHLGTTNGLTNSVTSSGMQNLRWSSINGMDGANGARGVDGHSRQLSPAGDEDERTVILHTIDALTAAVIKIQLLQRRSPASRLADIQTDLQYLENDLRQCGERLHRLHPTAGAAMVASAVHSGYVD